MLCAKDISAPEAWSRSAHVFVSVFIVLVLLQKKKKNRIQTTLLIPVGAFLSSLLYIEHSNIQKHNTKWHCQCPNVVGAFGFLTNY